MATCYVIYHKKKHGKKYHAGRKKFHKKSTARRYLKRSGRHGTIRKVKCGKKRHKKHHK